MSNRLLALVVVVAAAATVVAQSASAATIVSSRTICGFTPRIVAPAPPGALGPGSSRTVCFVDDVYALGGGLCQTVETSYVFVGNAGAGPILSMDRYGILYGAFRSDAQLVVFGSGTPNPYTSSGGVYACL
ncbi:MAG TPA: hypothetical protein VF101_11595 [Gaiellaceae bacterium]